MKEMVHKTREINNFRQNIKTINVTPFDYKFVITNVFGHNFSSKLMKQFTYYKRNHSSVKLKIINM